VCRPWADVELIVCRPWADIELNLRRPWADAELIVCRPWADIELNWCRLWADVELIVCRPWADVELIVCRPWADIELIVCRPWADVELIVCRPWADVELNLSVATVGIMRKLFHFIVWTKRLFSCVSNTSHNARSQPWIRLWDLTVKATALWDVMRVAWWLRARVLAKPLLLLSAKAVNRIAVRLICWHKPARPHGVTCQKTVNYLRYFQLIG
jgi:hypothetical protein